MAYYCPKCHKVVEPEQGRFQHPDLMGWQSCFICPICKSMVYLKDTDDGKLKDLE